MRPDPRRSAAIVAIPEAVIHSVSQFGRDAAQDNTAISGDLYCRLIDTASGRFGLIEISRESTLVPWLPVLARHLDKTVACNLRGDGVSWSIGRGRSGPSIS